MRRIVLLNEATTGKPPVLKGALAPFLYYCKQKTNKQKGAVAGYNIATVYSVYVYM